MPAAPMTKFQNISQVGFATLLKYSTDVLTNERTTLCLPYHAPGLSFWLDLADPSACLVFPQHELHGRTTSVNVKRLLPPRQSRATSHGRLGRRQRNTKSCQIDQGSHICCEGQANTKGTIMYTNILIATDGSELSEKAVNHGIALAKRIGAKVTVLTVVQPLHTFTAEYAEKTLGAAARLAQASGVECEGVHVEHDFPYQAIIDTAASKGCDLIVMASHGRHGISALVLGSETVKVLTHSKIPVLVHR